MLEFDRFITTSSSNYTVEQRGEIITFRPSGGTRDDMDRFQFVALDIIDSAKAAGHAVRPHRSSRSDVDIDLIVVERIHR